MTKTLVIAVLSAIIVFSSCSASRRGYGCPATEKNFWYKMAGAQPFSYDRIR
jgi:hypothetical protein